MCLLDFNTDFDTVRLFSLIALFKEPLTCMIAQNKLSAIVYIEFV